MLHSCQKCGEPWEGDYVRANLRLFDVNVEEGSILSCPSCEETRVDTSALDIFCRALRAYNDLLDFVNNSGGVWEPHITADCDVYFYCPTTSQAIYVWDLNRVRIVEYIKGEKVRYIDERLDRLQIVNNEIVFVDSVASGV